MTKHKKRVVTFIVEGPTDENAIGSLMKENFSNQEVQFVVIHGDITANTAVKPGNILIRIQDILKKMMGQYGYQKKDMKRIFHIVDMDGACIPDEAVHHDKKQNKPHYFMDHIDTSNTDLVIDRNKRKQALLFKLHHTPMIYNIPYSVFYNSRNLEHVLYNIYESISDADKVKLADDFAEKYDGDIDGFIKLISSEDIAVPGTFGQTWAYIEKDYHSLERHSNMHLIFRE